MLQQVLTRVFQATFTLGAILLLSSLLAPRTQAAAEYELRIIEAFGGSIPECYIYDLNDLGHASGTSTYESFYSGFFWDSANDKSLVPITWAEGINNLDQIVGDTKFHDVTQGTTWVVPPLNSYYATIYLHGLNDNGIAVGHAKGPGSDSDGVNRTPIIWDPENGTRGIEVLAAREFLKINNNSWAVGNIRWSAGDSEAFVHNIETGETVNLHELLSPNGLGTSSMADVNDNNVVTGEGWNGTAHQGFIWSQADGFTYLPGLNGGETSRVHPREINDQNQVVGNALEGISNDWQAFLWDPINGMRNLNDLVEITNGFVLDRANAINDQGWIGGYGHFGPGWGPPLGFVLVPLGPSSAPVVDSHLELPLLRLARGTTNPSSGSLGLEFALPVPGRVDLSIFGVDGARVATLLNRSMESGSHRITWNGLNHRGVEVPQGVYFVNLQTEEGRRQLRIVRVR